MERCAAVSATAEPLPAAAPPDSLKSLPRPGILDVVGGLQQYFRPRTHRSPLSRQGERFLIDFPGTPRLLITRSTEDAKTILTDRAGALSLGEALHRLTPHPVLFGADSLIFLEGEAHTRERRTMAPPFHGAMMKSYEQAVVDTAHERIDSWPRGRPIAVLPLARRFVLDVMRTVVFGVSEPERVRRLDQAMVEYCQVMEGDAFLTLGILQVMLTGRWRRYPPLDRAAAAVDAIVLEEIAARRDQDSSNDRDFLGVLLTSEEHRNAKDDQTLARDLRGLMLAGYETTAINLAWAVEMLAQHPQVLSRCVATVDAGEEDYLEAVIAEVMRLRPVFPFTGRKALREFDLGSIRVPAGTMLVISIMAIHERPDLYPDPLKFRPERFLGARPGTYSWLTFGGGVHRCLGAAFAQFETKLLLRTLIAQRQLRALGDRPEPPRRTHPMLIPSAGGRVVLDPR